MKKSILLTFGFVTLLSNFSCKSNYEKPTLTCSDFKIGKFYIQENEESRNYTVISNDSTWKIKDKNDSAFTKIIIVRKENSQIENKIEFENPKHEIIEWIDDCTYRLTYDSLKMELDEGEKMINKHNGIVVTKRLIEGKCMLYTATITINNAQKISQDGIICKE